MKHTNLLALSLIALFALVAVSCTTTQGMYDDEEQYQNARQVGNRIYVDDPYYGTIVLERDPYTGRYHDVTFGTRSLRSPYSNWRDYRYDRYYDNRPYYRQYSRNGNVQTPQPQPPAQSDEQKRKWQQERDEARRKILGERKN